MDPTCRGFDSDLGECGLPKSSISDLYKAVGSNTPGAASSAADLEAQEAPKSRPRREKIDVKNQYVFGIDFLRVRASFWIGFW